MTTEAQAGVADAPLTIDALAAEFDAEAAAVGATEEEDPSENVAGEQEEIEAEADGEEDELLTDGDQEDGEDEREHLPPPKSWAAEDHAAWSELTPKAQEVVLKREADRDRAVADAATKAGKAVAEVKQLAQNYETVAQAAADEVTRASQDWHARWGNVDWVTYARQNPQACLEDKTLADAERQQIIDYVNHQTKVKADADKAAQLARNAYLSEEWTKLAELSPELTEAEKGQERRKEVIEYLGAQGFTQDVLSDISAVEMTLARKAMLWDNAQKAAKTQAAIPRKNPTNGAKALPSSGGSGVPPSSARIVSAANARLSKNGGINDLVALFDAEDAAKARKGTRK